MLLVRFLEEAVTNALKHGGASSLRVRGAEDAGVVVLTLDDDGRGIAEDATRSGLARLERQLAVYGGSLELSDSPVLAGARLRARLPLSGAAPGGNVGRAE
jgi:signal transduction histidine kinase